MCSVCCWCFHTLKIWERLLQLKKEDIVARDKTMTTASNGELTGGDVSTILPSCVSTRFEKAVIIKLGICVSITADWSIFFLVVQKRQSLTCTSRKALTKTRVLQCSWGLTDCGELTLAQCQVPAPLFLSWTRQRKSQERLVGWNTDRKRLLTNYHHGQNKFNLLKSAEFYYQSIQCRNMKNKNQILRQLCPHPLLLPRPKFTPVWRMGVTVITHHCSSVCLTLFPSPAWSSTHPQHTALH